ncbi:MAG: DUF1122 family protein [Candidatus Altiarchaeota archaeon]|nr:DUF1122 family protein [Candidatus Altiarchaeota archaeon]
MMSHKLLEFVAQLKKGIQFENNILIAKVKKSKFRGQYNLVVSYNSEELFQAKVFKGDKKFLFPWIEIFTINSTYFDSKVEKFIMKKLSKSFGPGGRIFVEYGADKLTYERMWLGVPPAATRLGYLMYTNGFTWFKDWYFPEGFYEGDVKLQAEKPINIEAKKRHVMQMKDEMKKFLKSPLSKKFKEDAMRAKLLLDN